MESITEFKIAKYPFEDYLKEVHANEYTGTDDDMPEAFEYWLSNLDVENIISYGDIFAKRLLSEINEK